MTFIAREAAARLRALDQVSPGRNGNDLFITASGGYGSAKQAVLLADLRAVYAYVLGEKAHRPDPFPPPPEAA